MPHVRVYVDASDVLEELDIEDLKSELERRGVGGESFTDPHEARVAIEALSTAIHTGRPAAIVLELARAACEACGHSPLPLPARTS